MSLVEGSVTRLAGPSPKLVKLLTMTDGLWNLGAG